MPGEAFTPLCGFQLIHFLGLGAQVWWDQYIWRTVPFRRLLGFRVVDPIANWSWDVEAQLSDGNWGNHATEGLESDLESNLLSLIVRPWASHQTFHNLFNTGYECHWLLCWSFNAVPTTKCWTTVTHNPYLSVLRTLPYSVSGVIETSDLLPKLSYKQMGMKWTAIRDAAPLVQLPGTVRATARIPFVKCKSVHVESVPPGLCMLLSEVAGYTQLGMLP